MIDRIVYTYKTPQYNIYNKPTDQLKWIQESVSSAKSLGYNTLLITDDPIFGEQSQVDNIVLHKDSSYVWDSFKIHALEVLEGGFFLSDNDVIFHKRLEFDVYDMYHDTLELDWNRLYKQTVEKVEALKLLKHKPYWHSRPTPVVNAGVLYFKNEELKRDYIREWKDVEALLNPHREKFNRTMLTAFISQYILTLLIADCNTQYFSNQTWPSQCEYYTHYAGMSKIEKSVL